MPNLWLDDRPIEEFGLDVSRMDGWWDAPGIRFPANPLAGRAGARATDRGATSGVRRVPLVTVTNSTTVEERRAQLDALAYALTGIHEFRTSDEPEVVAYGTLERSSVQFLAPQLTEPSVVPTHEIVFENPLKYDRRLQMLVAPSASIAKTVPCGTWQHRGRLWVMDELASRAIDVVAGDGRVLYQLRLTGTLAANEYLEVDMDRDAPTITHVSGGVRTDVFSWLNPLDAVPTFDPRDRPGIRHTGGGSLVLFYRRAWLV